MAFGPPPYRDLIGDATHDRVYDICSKNPFALSRPSCAEGNDAELRAFASELDETFQIFDLRNPQVGMGFTWNLGLGPVNTKRFGEAAIFAVRNPPRKPGLLNRLFGR